MTFRVEEHIWETSDGELVAHGDERARFLKFPAETELSDAEAKRLGLPLKPASSGDSSEPETKPRAAQTKPRKPRTRKAAEG